MSELEERQKIGLLGGTFDPVHEGHVAVARGAVELLSLDRIIFIPAADPPHKKMPGASYNHRVAMLETALAEAGDNNNKFAVSLLEAERKAPSYTFDTLLELKKRLGEQKFFFIVGSDSLVELHLWYRYRELPELTDFIVAARPGISMFEIKQAIKRLPGPFIQDKSGLRWRRMDGAEIYYMADLSKNISSSKIRLQISQGQQPVTINRRVLDYIVDQGLYQSEGLRH